MARDQEKSQTVYNSEMFQQLSQPEYRQIFELLFSQRISPKKAIEAIAVLNCGFTPSLPKD